MNKNFVIILTLILVIIFICQHICGCENNYSDKHRNMTPNDKTTEPFCTKDGNKRGCLEDFTYAYELPNNKAVLIKNGSIGPVTITTNNLQENVVDYKCVPSNWPDQNLNGKDCEIFDIASANSARKNSSNSNFKNPAYYFNCAPYGKSLPGCKAVYDAMKLNSYEDYGFSCELGNGTIPVRINPDGVIDCAATANGECLVRSSKEECKNLLKLVPTITPITAIVANKDTICDNLTHVIGCPDGKVGTPCVNLYEKLGLKTFKELGYTCNQGIESGKLKGKKSSDSSYNFASYDNTNIIPNDTEKSCAKSLNFHPTQELKDVVCSEYTTSTDPNYIDACKQAFTQYNLFPSNNPLVIKGNDPNYTIKNTFDNATDLFNVYSKYQSAFPPNTNSNSSDGIKVGIQSILSETPLKLGCCKRTNPTDNTEKVVNVRVPVNPTIESINPNTSKFNFQYSQVLLGENSCPTDLYWGSTKCDNFYGLNCENIINYMKSQGLDVEKELLSYAPECACYAPQTKSQAGYPSTTPSVCYKNGCDLASNPSVYIDPGSRNGNEVKTCSLSICNSINDFSGMTIGGSATISPQTQNQCGGIASSDTNSNTNTQSSSSSNTSNDTQSKTSSNTPSNTSSNTPSNTSNSNQNKDSTNAPSSTNNQTGISSSSDTGKNSNGKNSYVIILVVVVLLLLSCSSGFAYNKST